MIGTNENNPLLSNKECERINEYIRKNIDSRLFVFRHYNPESYKVFGIDARFLKEVANYYKMMLDASLCKKFAHEILQNNYHKYEEDIKILKDNYRLANCLRTALAHNQSSEDYNDDEMKGSKEWLRKTIGFMDADEITDAGQYEEPIEKLEKNACDVIEAMNNIIRLVERDDDRAKIVDEWINSILEEYKCVNGKTRIRKLIERYSESKNDCRPYREWKVNEVFIRNEEKINKIKNAKEYKLIEDLFSDLQRHVAKASGYYKYLNGYIVFIQEYIIKNGKAFSEQEKIGFLPEEFAYRIVKYCYDGKIAKLVIKQGQ